MNQIRIALVTGSTSGIGLAVAEALAQAGCRIMLNGLGIAEQIKAARARVAAHGVEVDFHGADLSKAEGVEALVHATEARFGRIDILVNNAGIQHTARIEDFPAERWDAILAINLSATFHALRCALPGMQARGYGRIINIASVHGLVASVKKSAYVAAKHGIVGLTKVTALENAEANITCNAICPGWVLTPLVQKQIDARAERGSRHGRRRARPAGREAAQPALHPPRGHRRRGVVPVQPGGGQHHRNDAHAGWGLDGRLKRGLGIAELIASNPGVVWMGR